MTQRPSYLWIIFTVVFAVGYGILCLLRWMFGIEVANIIALVGGLVAGIALWRLP